MLVKFIRNYFSLIVMQEVLLNSATSNLGFFNQPQAIDSTVSY